jgi:hypothetical protein
MEKEVNISDMYFAAVLKSLGAEFTDTQQSQTDKRRLTFYLSVSNIKSVWVLVDGKPVNITNPTVDDIYMYYLNRTLLISTTFVESIREVKSAIYREREMERGGRY